jgi:predicted nucleic acid-binding protein
LVISDAGPLIHLDELGCVDLLADFPQVLVPNRVWDELTHHRPGALAHAAPRFQRITPPDILSPELDALSRLLALHRGEQEALQIASAHAGCLLLTDDTAARLAARSLGLAVHGTIGILIRSLRRKQKTKTEVLTILRTIPSRSTLHIRATLLEEVIEQVKQFG